MVLRQTGLREQEAIFLQWVDLDFGRKMLRVRSNPKEGFTIKDKEERVVPIPDALVKDLKSWKAARPKAQFVLGTGIDHPNAKLLRGLKRLVYRAGLNCGTCDGRVTRNECRKWNLHAFPRSYATSLSRTGIDARTIMALMGLRHRMVGISYTDPSVINVFNLFSAANRKDQIGLHRIIYKFNTSHHFNDS